MKTKLSSAGFSLVEVALVLGVASFVLLALVGLTATALNATKDSAKSLEAASVASQIAMRWRAMVEWNSDPVHVKTKTAAPSGFPVSIQIPSPDDLAVKGTPVKINSSGIETSNGLEQDFLLNYSIERTSDNPRILQLYLRLSWPAQAPETAAKDARTHYELFTSTLLNTGT